MGELQRHTLSNPEPSSFQLQAQSLERDDPFFKGPNMLLSDLEGLVRVVG